MSFDIWVGCMKNGSVSTFPLDVAERAFGSIIESREPGSWDLVDGGTIHVDDDATDIDGFTVNSPPGDSDEFWEGLLLVLRQTSSVLYWSDGAVVADAAVIAELPPDMIEVVGTPKVVGSAQDIIDAIEGS